MFERVWTEEQKRAIESSEKNILVSAGAGSGKTAVLTERVIRKLTDRDNPADISRMIIVTYTKAAAGELKERIGEAITKALASDPTNTRLRRQYLLLPNAAISTIHSFCFNIISKNFQKLGLSPSLRILEGGQATLMRRQVAETVINSYYEGIDGYTDIDGFVDFADNFISITDTDLSKILTDAYENVSSLVGGIEFLKNTAEEYRKAASEGIAETTWGDILFGYVKEAASFYRSVFMKLMPYIVSNEKVEKKYFGKASARIEKIDSIYLAACNRNIEELKTALALRLPQDGRNTPEFIPSEISDYLFFSEKYKEFEAKASKLLLFDNAVLRRDSEKCAELLEKLYLFLAAFERRYASEKRMRGLLDFADMERYAYQLLVGENGEPSEVALALSADYDEIYIDEYQDVNSIQDKIFSVFGSNCKRFMVGDIKQSIYGFRGSEPLIFANYRDDAEVERINLSKNFRCDKPIIDFANKICGALFKIGGTTFSYDSGDDLVLGKPDGGDNKAEITVFGYDNIGRASPPEEREAEYIAEKIEEMLSSREYNPSDICILSRRKSKFKAIEDALQRRGIPFAGQKSRDIFETPEILLLVSVLNVIDNPTRDIHLAAVLKSPLYNFSLEELIEIRRQKSDCSLYEALISYTEHTGSEKGEYFLNKLTEYRKKSNEPADKLIRYITNDCGYIACVTKGSTSGGVRTKKQNLNAFYEMARGFESGSFKGIYQFILFVTDLIESNESSDEPSTPPADAVTISTIHKSKGLEYKAVFLAFCGGALISTVHDKEPILYNRHIGAVLKLSDESGLAVYNTLFHNIYLLKTHRDEIEEEMRVLYVALTRPKTRIFVCGSMKNCTSGIEKLNTFSKYMEKGSRELIMSCDSYLSWIILAGGDSIKINVIPSELENITCEKDSVQSDKELTAPEEKEEITPEIISFAEEYKRRFDFIYPYDKAARLPAKLAVSDLYPTILDEHEDAFLYSDTRKQDMRLPRFVRSKKDTPAERGTATHQFMQFCDFGRLREDGLEKEISRLTESKFIDKHTAELINYSEVKAFTESKIFASLLASDYIKREIRFNIRLSAADFTNEEQLKKSLEGEFILVQGIMDCLFKDENSELVILDYKTDRIPRELCGDIKAAEKFLIDRHKNQLSYYLAACREMMCHDVGRVVLYSFALGKEIDIPLSELTLDRQIIGVTEA